jgi:hypothetical protein
LAFAAASAFLAAAPDSPAQGVPAPDSPVQGGPAQGGALPAGPVPSSGDAAFEAESAWNWSDVSREYGPFSAEQVAKLNGDRFLVVPQKDARYIPGDFTAELYDEMLYDFDGLGGPAEPAGREPRHARFVGPDVVLHAFHKYFSERLKEAERTTLSWLIEAMLAGFYDNALAMRAKAPKEARAAWDLALAQMLVPLTLIETRAPAPRNSSSEEPDGGDTLRDALRTLSRREKNIPEELRAAVRGALENVYSAGPSRGGGDPAKALGLAPAYAGDAVDWTQFLPRSHYSLNSRSRAYFRAAMWLGQLGWKRDDPRSLPALVAWVGAMSGPGGAGFAKAKANFRRGDPAVPPTPARAWWALMQVTSAFVGFYDDPSMREAMELATQGGQFPGPGAPADQDLLAGLGPRMALAVAAPAGFFEFRKGGYKGKGVITVLPQRFTVPWLLASELTSEAARARGESTDLPTRFSGLYLAWALGSSYAGTLSWRQIDGVLEAPGAAGEGAASPPPAPAPHSPAAEAMAGKAAGLNASLGRLPSSDWGTSVGGAWFNALRSLTRTYGGGYPLYMQSGAFSAKQLETLMGSWTELKHDTLLYEKPNVGSEYGGVEDEGPKRLPKGFVEPNMEFWDGMLTALDVTREAFRRNGLFQGELEEFGRLARFRADVERLRGIAARELAGTPVSPDDYEFVRTFRLQDLAERPGTAGGEASLSGLAVDVQTVLDGDAGVVHEGLGPPSLMLVLVGNDGERRVAVGMAYNHYEFFVSPVARIADGPWKAVAYKGTSSESMVESQPAPGLPELPPKPFWYRPLLY